MAAIRPATHSNWVRTKWSLDALEAREAPRILTSRMNDRSSEVTGEPMQVLNIPEMVELVDNAVGDNGEVTEQSPPATNQTLTIDQYRESTLVFRNDYKFQVALKEGKWSKFQGRALKERMETYALGLHTSVNAAGAVNIAGSIVDATLLALKSFSITNRWPKSNLHLLVSAAQMVEILGDDRHSELTFIGDEAGAPVVTGRIPAVYGFEPATSDLVLRVSVSGTTRTINMAWVGKDPMGGAFVKGVQQDVTVDMQKVDLQHKVIASTLYGVSLVRGGATMPNIRLLRTTDA